MSPMPAPTPEFLPLSPVGFDLLTAGELTAPLAGPAWVWEGYLAAGEVTLLTGPWKGGKTTLLSVLLARMGPGGALAGRAVRPGRAVVVSEEGPQFWADRCHRLRVGPDAGFVCQPFAGRRPTPADWRALAEHLAARRVSEGLDLVAVDPLAAFLPGPSESDPASLADLFAPLRRLAAAGVSVLVTHHPRRAPAAVGQAARGGRAVGEFVDITVELDWLSGPLTGDRRRKLAAFSRHPETPRRLVIELTPDGTDYQAVGDAGPLALDDGGWPVLLRVLAEAGEPLTRPEVLAGWPADCRRPDPATVWRWLARAAADGRVVRAGTGRPRDPFRYALPAGRIGEARG